MWYYGGNCLLLVELNVNSVEPGAVEGGPDPRVRIRTLRSGSDVITSDAIEIDT
jgi:hypothetical protein